MLAPTRACPRMMVERLWDSAVRPEQALRTPRSCYTMSTRLMPAILRSPEYPTPKPTTPRLPDSADAKHQKCYQGTRSDLLPRLPSHRLRCNPRRLPHISERLRCSSRRLPHISEHLRCSSRRLPHISETYDAVRGACRTSPSTYDAVRGACRTSPSTYDAVRGACRTSPSTYDAVRGACRAVRGAYFASRTAFCAFRSGCRLSEGGCHALWAAYSSSPSRCTP